MGNFINPIGLKKGSANTFYKKSAPAKAGAGAREGYKADGTLMADQGKHEILVYSMS